LAGDCCAARAAAAQQIAAPNELVRQTVRNEISASDIKFIRRERRQIGEQCETKLLVDTNDATAGLLIEKNGRPLTLEERNAELDRLEGTIKNSGELEKKAQREKEDADRARKIIAALPEAFLYERAGSQASGGGMGKPGDELVRLGFRPNPSYVPPSRIEQVLVGMAGFLLIDSSEDRLAAIDGTLVKDVGFGWGVLGRLNAGGHFVVEQADAGAGNWEVTRVILAFTGKILLFKNLKIESNEVFSDFRPAPRSLTFAEGVALLEKQQAALSAENREATSAHK
jgi:hypothetical protein